MEVLTSYKNEIMSTIMFLTLPFLVFIISLAHVYLWGRMLQVISSVRNKNLIAVITILVCYIYYFNVIDNKNTIFQNIAFTVLYTAISIIFYVFIGFDFYERINKLQDKLTGTIEHTEVKPVRKRKTK